MNAMNKTQHIVIGNEYSSNGQFDEVSSIHLTFEEPYSTPAKETTTASSVNQTVLNSNEITVL